MPYILKEYIYPLTKNRHSNIIQILFQISCNIKISNKHRAIICDVNTHQFFSFCF